MSDDKVVQIDRFRIKPIAYPESVRSLAANALSRLIEMTPIKSHGMAHQAFQYGDWSFTTSIVCVDIALARTPQNVVTLDQVTSTLAEYKFPMEALLPTYLLGVVIGIIERNRNAAFNPSLYENVTVSLEVYSDTMYTLMQEYVVNDLIWSCQFTVLKPLRLG